VLKNQGNVVKNEGNEYQFQPNCWAMFYASLTGRCIRKDSLGSVTVPTTVAGPLTFGGAGERVKGDFHLILYGFLHCWNFLTSTHCSFSNKQEEEKKIRLGAGGGWALDVLG
jgi:hypothetical protein